MRTRLPDRKAQRPCDQHEVAGDTGDLPAGTIDSGRDGAQRGTRLGRGRRTPGAGGPHPRLPRLEGGHEGSKTSR